MTNPERILNLQKLGYTEREASFLTIAALHSGYCVRRQFCYFTGTAVGGSAEAFFKKAISNQHAKAVTYRGDRIIYHLASKPLFAALGESDNRNRRAHEVQTIKARLMGLDYVLQHPNLTFAATEIERVAVFESRGIALTSLPFKQYKGIKSASTTTRYFVEKFPIATDSDGEIHMCYIDEGLHSTAGFQTFLHTYTPLLRSLSRSILVFIAPYDDGFSRAEAVFDRLLRPSNTPLSPELMRHFADRKAFEFGLLDQAGLNRYRDEKPQFTGTQFDVAFAKWKQNLCQSSAASSPIDCQFSAYHLQFDYDLLGSAFRHGKRLRPFIPQSAVASYSVAAAASPLVVRKSHQE